MRACMHRTRWWREERGSALIETAIIMPAYVIILLGAIFFGNVMLGRQKLCSAAWLVGLTGTQNEEALNTIFCLDVAGQFAVSPDSGTSDEDVYGASDMSVCFDDLSMKHQWRGVRMVNGKLEPYDFEVDDYSSRFMEQINADRDIYERALVDSVNRDSDNRLWLQRSSAQISYSYTPEFVNMFLGRKGEHLTQQEYLSLDTPETDVELPEWEGNFEMIIRGEGSREGPRNIGGVDGESVTGHEFLSRTLGFLANSGFSVDDTARTDVRTFEPGALVSPYWKPGGP